MMSGIFRREEESSREKPEEQERLTTVERLV